MDPNNIDCTDFLFKKTFNDDHAIYYRLTRISKSIGLFN